VFNPAGRAREIAFPSFAAVAGNLDESLPDRLADPFRERYGFAFASSLPPGQFCGDLLVIGIFDEDVNQSIFLRHGETTPYTI
jgi:hypothetical protein